MLFYVTIGAKGVEILGVGRNQPPHDICMCAKQSIAVGVDKHVEGGGMPPISNLGVEGG